MQALPLPLSEVHKVLGHFRYTCTMSLPVAVVNLGFGMRSP